LQEGDKAAATMAPPAAMQSGPARKYKEPPKSGTVPTKTHRIRNTCRDVATPTAPWGPWILGYKVAAPPSLPFSGASQTAPPILLQHQNLEGKLGLGSDIFLPALAKLTLGDGVFDLPWAWIRSTG